MKVLIADDSALYRQFLRRSLEGQADIEIVGHAMDGMDAIKKVERMQPDVVTLDMNMPEMNGLEALKVIRERFPAVKVLIVSSETASDADLAVQLLDAGAFDVILKPKASTPPEEFRGELLGKLRATDAPKKSTVRRTTPARPVATTKPAASFHPDILAIGSSTGGPAALHAVLEMLPADLNVPVVIVQHMPKLFLESLVSRLNSQVAMPCRLVEHGQRLLPGHIYIAPGESHLDIRRLGQSLQAHLHDGPAEHHCKPAVDVTFRSLAQLAPSIKTLAVVLTGMGSDGALGAHEINKKGGYVIAQDQATSVVWGMPGATVQLGAAHAVLPLKQIAAAALQTLGREVLV